MQIGHGDTVSKRVALGDIRVPPVGGRDGGIEYRMRIGEPLRARIAELVSVRNLSSFAAASSRAAGRFGYGEARAAGKLYGGKSTEAKRRSARRRSRRRRQERNASGLRVRCGHSPPVPGRASCEP